MFFFKTLNDEDNLDKKEEMYYILTEYDPANDTHCESIEHLKNGEIFFGIMIVMKMLQSPISKK